MSESSDEEEQLFHLVFPGNILPGSEHDEVVLGLSRLLKTPPDSTAKLISGKRRYVKRTFTLDKARQLRAQVVKLGVECELEPVGEVKKTTQKRKKSRHKEAFPDPEDFAMQAADTDHESDQSMSYSQTMAELQQLADKVNQENHDIDVIDFSTYVVDAEEVKKEEIKSVSQAAVERRQAHFIVENVDDYLPRFDKFQQGVQSHFVFTWHWPAFFVPFFWAMYRKLWGWSVIIFISSIFWPLTNIFWAITANYIYFRHSERKIKKIREKFPPDEIDEKLAEAGGTSSTAMAAAMLAVLLLMTGVYWSEKLSPVFSTLNQNLEKIEQSKDSTVR